MSIDTTARFIQKFEVDDRQASAAMGGFARKAKTTTGVVSKLSGEIKGLLAAAAAGLSIAGLKQLTTDSIAAVQKFRALSLAMGGTIEQAAVMSDVFQSAGVDIEAANEALGKWGMAQAAAARLKPGEALGGELRAWAPLLDGDFAKAMVKIGAEVKSARSETERLAIATGYFGEAGRKFLPVLMESQATLSKIASGEGAGHFNAETAAALERSRRDLAAIDQEWSQIKVAIAREVAPPLLAMAREYMPSIKAGAESVASALGFIAEHADDIAKAATITAAAWAAMKTSNMVANFAATARYATQIAAAAKATAAANAAGAFAGVGAAARVAGPASFTRQVVGAGGAAAGGAAAGGIGAKVMGALGKVGRFARGGIPGLALLGLGYTAFDAFAQEDALNANSNLPPHLRRAYGSKGGGPGLVDSARAAIEAQRELAAAQKAELKQVEDTEEALKRFEKTAGISSDRLKDLGFDLADFGAAVQRGGRAADRAYREALRRDFLRQAGDDRQKVDQLQRDLIHMGPLVDEANRTGQTVQDLAMDRLAAVQTTMKRIRAGRKPLQGDLQKLGLSGDVTLDELADMGKGLKGGAARIEAARQAKALADIEASITGISEGIKVTYNIGSVTIQQDLRGEDPDRVMIAVTEGLLGLSEHRTQARTGPHPMARRR